MTAPKEMSILRRISRVGGFILRHWKKVMVGIGAAGLLYLVWRAVT